MPRSRFPHPLQALVPMQEEETPDPDPEERAIEEAEAEPAPVLHQLPPRALPAQVSGHPAVRRVGQILANGTRFAPHAQIRFSAHSGLLIQLENTYNRRGEWPIAEAENRFLEGLRLYLEQASAHIPQAARSADVPALIEQLRLLLGETGPDGLYLLGRYLLALAHAPVDRF